MSLSKLCWSHQKRARPIGASGDDTSRQRIVEPYARKVNADVFVTFQV